MGRKGFDGSRLEWKRRYRGGAGLDRRGYASSSDTGVRMDGYLHVWAEGTPLPLVAGSRGAS